MKKLLKKRYFHLTFSFSFFVGAIIALCDYLLINYAGVSFNPPRTIGDTVTFTASILAIFLIPMLVNWCVIREAFKDGLLDDAIAASIEGAKQKSERDKYSHFLREITQADRLYPLELKIDDAPFDNIYDAVGTLSITEAPLFAWKNPEYSWFLLSHYVSTLLHRIDREGTGNSKKVLSIVDRGKTGDPHSAFIKKGFDYLEAIANSGSSFVLDDFARIFILDRKEVIENKALCQQLVSGHDLFGIHAFIIDKAKVMSNTKLCEHIEKLKSMSEPYNNVLDLMVFQASDGKIDCKAGKNGQLVSEEITKETLTEVQRFVEDLTKELVHNDNYLIYPTREYPHKFTIDAIETNKHKSFLKIV